MCLGKLGLIVYAKFLFLLQRAEHDFSHSLIGEINDFYSYCCCYYYFYGTCDLWRFGSDRSYYLNYLDNFRVDYDKLADIQLGAVHICMMDDVQCDCTSPYVMHDGRSDDARKVPRN